MLERVYDEAYAPFFDVLARHPGVKIGAHHSGSLLAWLERAHPEYLERLHRLVERGQVELLTGGFHEPVLAAIPDDDRRGQIEKQTAWLKARFGRKPVGLWLAERVWEPDLAGSLAEAGVKYTLVDDTHFLAAGAEADALDGPYLTEDRGRTLTVFPISKRLRYLVPFQAPEATLAFLREAALARPGRVFLLGDDGEKFGHWPDTHRQVYGAGWLDRFFTLLEENRAWLRTACPADAMKPVRGRIYLPTTSYEEMGEWTLPAHTQARFRDIRERVRSQNEDAVRFLHGGTWRAFLARYPESDRMYQRGLRLREEALRLDEPAAKERARDAIWASQMNCPYWHGVFGGVYLPHLRDAVWKQLLEAESIIVTARHGTEPWCEATHVDLDGDGEEEVLLRNETLSAVIDPSLGIMTEVSQRPKRIALSNGLTRRYEAYHDRLREDVAGHASENGVASIHDRFLVKETGLEELLHYDDYARLSLIDHWLPNDQDRQAFEQGRLPDLMGLRGPFRVAIGREPGRVAAVLRRASGGEEGRSRIVVEKSVGLLPGQSLVQVGYRVEAMVPVDPAWFGVEMNFAMLDARSPGRRFRFLDELEERELASRGEMKEASGLSLWDRDRGFEVTMRWNKPARVWWAPVETVSLSESGLERVYQSTAVLPAWHWNARPGDPLLIEMTLELATTA